MTVVETTSGKLEGFEKRGVLQFRGVPYAAPPVGDLRLAPPAPPAPWPGVRAATEFSAVVPQNLSSFHEAFGASLPEMDEASSLTLNVWTPGCDDARRPVMVWLHGGAYVMGDGRTGFYDGVHLSRGRDVVVVTCNYRLGFLGYLHLGDLAAEHGDDSFAGSGNSGLLDQIAVLEWVRDNISAFGGDPANVTVFGESAGAFSTGTLLGTPAATGLFHKAILQSGACEHVHDAETASAIAGEVLGELGIGPDDVAAVREVPVETFLAAQAAVSARRWGASGAGVKIPFQPVVDGSVLPEPPLEAVRSGSAAGIPVLTGVTREELKLFVAFDADLAQLSEAELGERVGRALGDGAAEVFAKYRSEDPETPARDLWQDILTARVFRIPCLHLLEAQREHSPSVFAYDFSWASPAWGGLLGASHAMDITFTFDNLDAPGANLFVGEVDDDMRALASACGDAWTAFARAGVPAAEGLPEWPAWEPERLPTMILDTPPSVAEDPWQFSRDAWAAVLDR